MSNIPDISITDNGVIVPSSDDVLNGVLDDLNNALGGTMNRDVTTPQGQIAMSMAWSITQKNKEFAFLANQFNPDFAVGRYQDALGAIYFIDRKPALGTTVTARCTGLVGTIIPKGSQAQDDNGYIYESENQRTIGSNGYVDILFINKTTGPIACPVGTLNTIYQNVVGWDSIINEQAGALGRDQESRNDFETRRRESVANNSKNQNGSILSAVLDVNNVVDAYVYSNDTGKEIEHGETAYKIAPHSLCISVYGGNNQEIAQAIWNKKNPGCGMVGNRSVNVQDRENYTEPYPSYKITFLIPTTVSIKFKVQIKKDENLPSSIIQDVQSVVKSIFVGSSGNGRARIGGRVITGRYFTAISNISDYVNIESILISKDGQTYSSSVVMGIDEMPVISDEDIEVILDEY